MKPSSEGGESVAASYSSSECCLLRGLEGVHHARVSSSEAGKRWMCESIMGYWAGWEGSSLAIVALRISTSLEAVFGDI